MDQKFPFGGLIGYGNFYLDSILFQSKVFRLHAILHDAAGAVRSHSGKKPGYCYMIRQGPSSCLLIHVTGLLICLYVRIFVPSIFTSVDFCNSISLIVLDKELAEQNINKQLRLFIAGSLQGFSFCPSKTFKLNNQTTWITSHLHEDAWSTGMLDYKRLFAVFYDIKVMKAEVFNKGFEKCRLLTRLVGQNVEKFDDYDCPKIHDLLGGGKTDSSWICSSYLFRQKSRLHCAERKAKVYGEGAMQHLNSYLLYVFILFVFTTNSILSP